MEKNNIPAESRRKAIDYKKNIAGKFMLVEGAKIKSRVDGTDFCVTRKIDGHLQCLFYQDGTAYMLNSGGNQLVEQLRCIDAFAEAMQQAGVSSAIVAAELFMPKEGGRPRCADVKRALADPALRDELRLAPFDILEVNGELWNTDHYKHTHAQLCKWFQGDDVIPVDMMKAESLEEVQTIYDEWVECQGAEGLVIHSDSHIICKVKPRHTIDAVIVGYTTGDKGVRDLMMAVRKEDGLFQVFAVGSGGLSDEARLSLLDRLCQQHVESQYILSDSRGIAYQMVKPEIVFELSVIELVAKGNDDKVRTNALLTFYYWYVQMKKASFVYVDEFDAFYHFELAEDIVSLVKEELDMQVIFTSHNTNLLSNRLLRPDCCFILTKDRLASFAEATDRELKEGHNLEKLYMSGEFDG